MRLRWYCGFNADTGGFFTEPEECIAEGDMMLSEQEQQDWHEGLTPCVKCPSCGAILEDPSHYTDVSPMSPMEEPEPWLAPPGWEPPLPDEWYEDGDHVLYEGGVWLVETTRIDEFDEREQKLNLRWIAGPRMGKIVYAAGIRSSDLKKLSDMEVVAYSSRPEDVR